MQSTDKSGLRRIDTCYEGRITLMGFEKFAGRVGIYDKNVTWVILLAIASNPD